MRQFHRSTLAALGELVSAAGLAYPNELRPAHILERISPSEVKSFAEVYVADCELLSGTSDPYYAQQWMLDDAQSFAPVPTLRAAA